MRILKCEPQVEVRGEVLLGLIHSLQSDDIAPYVQKYGLTNVKEGQWYRIELFLNLLNDLTADVNSIPNFVAIGLYAAENAYMPPELGQPTFEDMLIHWDDHYQGNHRNGNIGHKIAEKIDDTHYKMTVDHGIYPDDLEYGVLYGFAKRFLPRGTFFTVRYDENVQRLDEGGEKTVMHVQWKL